LTPDSSRDEEVALLFFPVRESGLSDLSRDKLRPLITHLLGNAEKGAALLQL